MQPGDTHGDHSTVLDRFFWDRYMARLQAQGVKPTVARWYVIRAEQYLRSVAQKRLADHTAQDVTQYLEQLRRKGHMPDWQYRQSVEAIQHVFSIAGVAWA